MPSATHTYIVECYAPGIDEPTVEAAGCRVRAAAATLRDAGRHIEYLNAILIGEDEVVFHVFEADGPETVREASLRAGVEFDRVVESIALAGGS